jgi:hypothetical protein
MERRADMFLNKIVACLYTRVAVRGGTFKMVSGGK